MQVRWLGKTDMAALIGLSAHTLRRYREQGEWQEGIHYSKLNQNTVVYNERLVLDWVANRNNQDAHKRAIERYLMELSANGEPPATIAQRKRQRKAAG